jgi:hypothetical protein
MKNVRFIFKTLVILYSLSLVSKKSIGQESNYIRKIDSLVSVIDNNFNLSITEIDGVIKKRKKNIGGFSESIYYSNEPDYVYKIIYNEFLSNYSSTSFYYWNGNLVMIQIFDDNNTNNNFPNFQYYFKNDILIHSSNNSEFKTKTDKLIQKSKLLYLDFYQTKN